MPPTGDGDSSETWGSAGSGDRTKSPMPSLLLGAQRRGGQALLDQPGWVS